MQPPIRTSVGTEPAVFPLSIKPGERYLVDAVGRPFLIQGDTAWSLIADLTREDVDLYLEDRRARGFNTILVSLIEREVRHQRASQRLWSAAVPEARGTTHAPNEAYFAHADWVLRRAAEKGFLVLLTPSYLGCRRRSRGLVPGDGRQRSRAAAPIRRISRPALP